MGVGSSGLFKAPGYAPFGEPEEVLVHLLIADQKVEGPQGRSSLSTSFRTMIGGSRPWPLDEWKQRWNLHRWTTSAAEMRFENLLLFLYLCAEAAREEDGHVFAAGTWCAWLPGFASRPEDTTRGAEEWIEGKPWTKLLQAALGSADERARFYRLWEGENPDPSDNSGDAFAVRRGLPPLTFTWNPFLEKTADARERLSAAADQYFTAVTDNLKASPRRPKRTRPAVNHDHLVWLARRLILGERPVDTAQAVYRCSKPTETARIRAGQKSVAEIIELALPRARSGPRPAL